MQIGALNKFGKSVCVPHEKIRFDGCVVVGFTAPADTVFAIADMCASHNKATRVYFKRATRAL